VSTSASRSPVSTEPLVDALTKRLRYVDLVGWSEITARAEEHGLSFENLRLLLAMTNMDGQRSVKELAGISGLSLDAAYPAIHHLRGRGYVREERRQYSLSEHGRELVAILEAAHRDGVRAYVDGLDDAERRRIDDAVRMS
jgi:DNA-binding MarR family transcriptional regulator